MDFISLNSFLSDLSENNHKDWFEANRLRYENLRKDWLGFTAKLIEEVSVFDSAILGLDPKKSIFRINRDVRFSKNKSPYKTNFGSILSPGPKKELTAGYYFHFGHDEIFIAGGIYLPDPINLASIRQEIDYNWNEFNQIVSDTNALKFFGSLSGDKLARTPKGYTDDNPAIEFLKHKSFIWSKHLDLAALVKVDFLKDLSNQFSLVKPLNDFINRSIKN